MNSSETPFLQGLGLSSLGQPGGRPKILLWYYFGDGAGGDLVGQTAAAVHQVPVFGHNGAPASSHRSLDIGRRSGAALHLQKLNLLSSFTMDTIRGSQTQAGTAAEQGTAPLTGVEHVATSRLPTRHGEFVMHAYRQRADGTEHAVLVRGDVAGQEDVLVRLHSECLTGDVLGSLRCDCGPQLEMSLDRIAAAGRGVLVYLRGHEGRGIGFSHKVRAYALQDEGLDTVDANVALGLPVDARSFDCAAEILKHLGVRSVHLLSNNPRKKDELVKAGMPVTRVVPVVPPHNHENVRYLNTKRTRMGHDLPG